MPTDESSKLKLSEYLGDICVRLAQLPEHLAVVDCLPPINANSLIAEKYGALVRVMRVRARHAERPQMFQDLISYTTVHFAAENSLMKILGYPAALHHAKQHASFISNVNRLLADVRSGTFTVEELVLFIGHWLVGHILLADSLFSEFEDRHLCSVSADYNCDA